MIAEELQVLIRAETQNAVRNLGAFSRQADQAEKSASSLTKSILAKGAAMAGAYVSYRAVIGFVKDAINAYGEQEKAERLLATAIEATGDSVDSLLPRYKKLAADIQSVTTVGDEQVLGLIRVARQYGLTGMQAEDATRGAIGLSKAFGIDMNAALRGISNAFQGNYEQLARYIPALRNAGTEAEKNAILQKAMGDGFKIAREEAKTTTGQIAQLKNATGDLMETIGEGFSSKAAPFITWLKSAVEGLDATIKRSRELQAIAKAFAENRTEELSATQRLTGHKERLAQVQADINYLLDANYRGQRAFEGISDADAKRMVANLVEERQQLNLKIQHLEVSAAREIELSRAREARVLAEADAVRRAEERKQEAIRKTQSAAEATASLLLEDDIGALYAERVRLTEGFAQDMIDAYGPILHIPESVYMAEKKLSVDLEALWVERLSRVISVANQMGTAWLGLYNLQTDLNRQAADEEIRKMRERISAMEESYRQELDLKKQLGIDTETFEAEYAERKAALEEQMAKREAQLKRRIFEQEKKSRIASTIMSGAEAVIATYRNAGGWPFGAALAAIMAGIIAKQVQLISSQTMPGLASGGNIVKAGSVLVGEKGPEVLSLPTGARVTPLDKAGASIVISGNTFVGVGGVDDLARMIDESLNRQRRIGAVA